MTALRADESGSMAKLGLVYDHTGRETRIVGIKEYVFDPLDDEDQIVGFVVVGAVRMLTEGGGEFIALRLSGDLAAEVGGDTEPEYAAYWCKFLKRLRVVELEP